MTTITEIKKGLRTGNWRSKLYMSSAFSEGMVAKSNKKSVQDSWETFPQKIPYNFIGCYAGYFGNNNKLLELKKWSYYVAFQAMPIWFPEFVDEFNNFFDNIKIEILDIKNYPIHFEPHATRVWGPTKPVIVQGSKILWGKGDIEKEICVPFIRLVYNEKYNSTVKFLFNYIIVILIRMLNYGEKYHHPFNNKPRDMMKYLVKLNNKNKGYRTFSEEKITLEELKLLDNIELVNSNSDYAYHKKLRALKQTDIFSKLTSNTYKKRIDFKSAVDKQLIKEERNAKTRLEREKEYKAANENRLLNYYTIIDGCNCWDCRAARELREEKGVKNG